MADHDRFRFGFALARLRRCVHLWPLLVWILMRFQDSVLRTILPIKSTSKLPELPLPRETMPKQLTGLCKNGLSQLHVWLVPMRNWPLCIELQLAVLLSDLALQKRPGQATRLSVQGPCQNIGQYWHWQKTTSLLAISGTRNSNSAPGTRRRLSASWATDTSNPSTSAALQHMF